MKNRRLGGFLTAFFAVAGCFLCGTAAGQKVILPEEIFFYQPVALASGQASVWINPAAIPKGQSGGMVLFTYRDGRLIRDRGIATTFRLFGTAYRRIEGYGGANLSEYLFALGGGQRNRLGLSYRYIKEGPGYLNKRHLWTIGFLSRTNANFSLGARVENFNRGKVDGRRSEMRFVYGGALRLYRDIVTASCDVDMTQKDNLRRATYRTGLQITPSPGLYCYADVTNHSTIQLGFRLNFGSSYAGHYHSFDRDVRSRGGTSYIGSVKGTQPSLTSKKHRTLVLPLSGELPENPKVFLFGPKPLRFFDLLDGIYRAAQDDAVEGMFLEIGNLTCGLGKVEELGEAIAVFRAQGKPVTAYLASPDNLAYLLGCRADSIVIPPVSELRLVGLRAELTSYKGLLDKLGVAVEVERVGDYKTAPEPFIFDHPTEPNRLQINRILDGLYEDLVRTVAEGRHLSRDSVMRLIDAAPLTSVEALDAGLIDGSGYLDDVRQTAVRSRGVSVAEYGHGAVEDDAWGETPHLAVIVADGDIMAGRSGGQVGEDELLGVIRAVREDNRIAGVVLRVNSPGGEVGPSDLLRHEVELTSRAKPLVISMGDVAASGGYYITSVGRPIFADRATLTGSIGVFAGKINLTSLYEKLNIYSETFRRGRNADMYSLTQPFTPDQRERLASEIAAFYAHFTQLVGQSRSLTADSVDALGRGRVWTGAEAHANGLIDRTGGMMQAIDEVRLLCGLAPNEGEVILLPQKRLLWENPFDPAGLLRSLYRRLSLHGQSPIWPSDIASGAMYCRLPYLITIR